MNMENRGGVIGAKVEHQDGVGIIIAVELLSGQSSYYDLQYQDYNWKLQFEGYDDIELFLMESRVYVQVKDDTITPSLLKEILEKWERKIGVVKTQKLYLYFRLQALSGLSTKLEGMDDKLKELHNSREVYTLNEYNCHLEELCKYYGIDLKYKFIVDKMIIDQRRLHKYGSEVMALFAHNLRSAYVIKDFGDKQIKTIFNELLRIFDERRMNRASISRIEILREVNSLLKSDFSLETEYIRSKYGYEVNQDYRKYLKEVNKGLRKAFLKLQREWIKTHWKSLLLNISFGSPDFCPICGHVLIANLFGVFGLACPDCGFQPFATLVATCTCGSYRIIKSQPGLTNDELIEEVREYFKNHDPKCNNPICRKNMVDDSLPYRIMISPFPDPMQKYVPGKIKETLTNVKNVV